jgi:polysaccharide biosynthesis transport protein
MEVRSYLAPLLKWWWLLLLAVGIAAGTSYFVEGQQPPVYKATTTLLIGRAINNPNPSSNDLYLSQQLAGVYADIAKRDPVRSATMSALGLTTLPPYQVNVIANTQLMEIDVTDTNPVVAQRVAMELATQLIAHSPSGMQQSEQNRQNFIQKQIDGFQKDITDTQKEISDKQQSISKLTSAKDIADGQQTIQALETRLSLLQTNFTNLVASTQNGASNTLSVLDPAALPTIPVGPSKWIIIAIAGLVGFVFAGGAAYLLEYLDDSLEIPDDISSVQGLPVLGLIADTASSKEKRAFMLDQPRSMIADTFRALRTNLELSQKQPLRTIFITSAEPGDGKTSVAINLALAFAQVGKKVIFLDADLRNPSSHERLNIDNQIGLGEVLSEKVDLMDTMQSYENGLMWVVPAGDTVNFALDTLDKHKAKMVIQQLTQIADVVLIDGTPLFVSDALIWASVVDGILFVIRPGHTRKASFRMMVDQLGRTGVNVLGVIFNRVKSREAGPYGGKRYYSSYYSKPVSDRKSWPWKKANRSNQPKLEPETIETTVNSHSS